MEHPGLPHRTNVVIDDRMSDEMFEPRGGSRVSHWGAPTPLGVPMSDVGAFRLKTYARKK